MRKDHAIKILFTLIFIIFCGVEMFTAGILVGKYGSVQLISVGVILGIGIIFQCGYFLGRYKSNNPF